MGIKRPDRISLGGCDLALPVFFPSVSSVKTAMLPLHYVELLASLTTLNGQFLISAFDIWQASDEDKQKIWKLSEKARNDGAVVLMDSGNYESYWKDASDNWAQTDFHSILGKQYCSFAFGYDEQFPPFDSTAHVKLVSERWKLDQDAAGKQPIVPIVHGSAADLPELVLRVAEITGVTMIAVPERRLGNGIFDRANAVKAIRESLNASGRYVALHLLGTGNPISIAIYSICGADSFDGLEWCQTVVDHETALLFHLTQADFFRGQTGWADTDLSFQACTLAHNLEFYMDWMSRLRKALHTGRWAAFCQANFPSRIYGQCSAALGWERVS